MFGFDLQVIEGVLLAFFRIGTAFFLMPVFGYLGVPVRAKIGTAFIIALVLGPYASDHLSSTPPGFISIFTVVIGEIMVGIMFGLVTMLVLIGAEFAGSIIGLQMGFGIVNVMDPQSGQQVSIIGRLEYLVALMIFISLDLHQNLLVILRETFDLIPLGSMLFTDAIAVNYGHLTGQVFIAAVKLAAPVMAILLLSEMSLGFIARTMPQMNVFIVGFPLKIGLGLFGLAVSWPLFVYVISKVFRMFEDELRIIIAAAAGTI